MTAYGSGPYVTCLYCLNGNHAQITVLFKIRGKAVAELVQERQPRFIEVVHRVEDESPVLEAAGNLVVPGTVIAEFSLDVFCRCPSDRGINPTTRKLDFEHRPPAAETSGIL